MVKKFGFCLSALLWFAPAFAQAEEIAALYPAPEQNLPIFDAPAAPAAPESVALAPAAPQDLPFFEAPTSPVPVVTPALDDARIQGITNTLIQYPAQTPAILTNYVGVDTSRIDMDQFMEIVNRGNSDEISAEVTKLYQNRNAFNQGTFTNVPYYREPQQPLVFETAETRAVSPPPYYHMTNAVFYTGVGVGVAGIAALAAGSGGGGGGSSGATNDSFGRTALPDLFTPSSFVDSEFSAFPLDALARENVQYAYAKGLTGAGVKIGFYDFFTDDETGNSELNSRIIYRDLNIPLDTAALALDCALYNVPEACNHGEVVMQYAASERDGANYVGIANQASLLMNSVYATYTATPLADQGSDIINFSCTGCAMLSDLQYIADRGILMTAASGNGGTANPDPTSPAAYASQLGYKLIAVSGLYESGGVTTSAAYDKCGTQAEFCMVAYSDVGTSFAAPQIAGAAALIKEGWNFLTAPNIAKILLYSAKDIGTPGVDVIYGHGLLDLKAAMQPIGSSVVASGTGRSVTFAPSVISQNRNTAFGDAFSAAKNAKGNVVLVDSFGRDFAVKPQENLFVAASRRLSPDKMASFGKKAAIKTVRYSDQLSMGFQNERHDDGSSDIASFVAYDITPSAQFTLGFSTSMDNIAANETQKFNTANFIGDDVFKNGFLNVSDNDQVFHQSVNLQADKYFKTKISSFYSKNRDEDYFKPKNNQITSDFASSMAETIFTPSDALNINFKNGVTHEFDSILGSKFSGSFDMANGANTYFSGLDVSYDFPANWNLFGSYLFGTTQATPSATSAFSNVSDLTSDSFAVTATKNEIAGHDALSFSVGQPTRVRSGSASGVTQQVDHATGDVSLASFQQSLVPTGRTIQFQAAYQRALSDDINMNVALEYETQPYQQQDAPADKSALVKLMYKM